MFLRAADVTSAEASLDARKATTFSVQVFHRWPGMRITTALSSRILWVHMPRRRSTRSSRNQYRTLHWKLGSTVWKQLWRRVQRVKIIWRRATSSWFWGHDLCEMGQLGLHPSMIVFGVRALSVLLFCADFRKLSHFRICFVLIRRTACTLCALCDSCGHSRWDDRTFACPRFRVFPCFRVLFLDVRLAGDGTISIVGSSSVSTMLGVVIESLVMVCCFLRVFVQGPRLTKVTEAVAGFGDMVSTRTLVASSFGPRCARWLFSFCVRELKLQLLNDWRHALTQGSRKIEDVFRYVSFVWR